MPKFNTYERLIASKFFGMFLLIAGLGAGVILVTQPQLFRQKASVLYSPIAVCATDLSCADTQIIGGSGCTDPTTNATKYCCPGGSINQNGVCSSLQRTSCTTTTDCSTGFACNPGTKTCEPIVGYGNCANNTTYGCYVTTGVGTASDGSTCQYGGHWTICPTDTICSNYDCEPKVSIAAAPKATSTPIPTASPTPTNIDQKITAAGDDYNITGCGTTANVNEVYLGIDTGCSSNPYLGYFVFNNINVVRYTSILNSYLEFTLDGPYSNTLNLSITATDGYTTSSPINWSITNSWTTGTKGQTPSLNSIIQQVVSASTWSPGHNLTFKINYISGNSTRRVFAYERDPASAARLLITTGAIGPSPSPSPAPTIGPIGQVTKKVLVLDFDPLISGVTPLHLYAQGWNDPFALITRYVSDIKSASQQYINYQIVNHQVIRDYPVKSGGFKFTEAQYLGCLANASPSYCGSGVDYYKILNDYNVCAQVNSGAIDELWLFGGPWFGYHEASMAGPGAFDINGGVLTGTICNRKLPIMGFNYERGVQQMTHSMSHRVENTLTKIFGGDPYLVYPNMSNVWNIFWTYDKRTPGKSGCGFIHRPPNSQYTSFNNDEGYDFSNTNYVNSYCNDFLSYPSTIGSSLQINCSAWGCGAGGENSTDYFEKWWLAHIAAATGTINNKLSNWWSYVADYDNTNSEISNNLERWYSIQSGGYDYNTSCATVTSGNEIYLGLNSNCSVPTNYTAKLNFPSTQIPKDATVSQAYLELIADGPYTNPITENITLSDGTTTTTAISWPITASWNSQTIVKSPDLTGLVQQLLDSSTWANGKTIYVNISHSSGTGERRFFAFERESLSSARLVVRLASLSTPTLASPASNTLVTNFKPTFTWNASIPQPLKYELQIAKDANFINMVQDISTISGSQISYTLTTALTSNSVYYWRVRSFNNSNEPSKWSLPFILNVSPASTTITSPAGGSTIPTLKPTLAWNSVTGATSYEVWMSTDFTFGCITRMCLNPPFQTVINQSGTSYTFTSDLPSNTLIHWQVRANSGIGAGAWTYANFNTPNLLSSQYSTIDIYAASSGNNGYYPSMTLNLNNGSNLQTWLNVTGNPNTRTFNKYTYLYPGKLTNGNAVYIKYKASYIYAPLIVDKIVVDGVTYESESSNVYGVGVKNYDISPSCISGYRKTEALACTGYLKFTLDRQ